MGFKARLMKAIKAKEDERAALKTKGKASEDINEVRGIAVSIEKLDADIVELRSLHDSMPDDVSESTPPLEGEARRIVAQGQFNPLDTYRIGVAGVPSGEQRAAETDDKFATFEYRKAFMEYCKTGKITPELRADAMATASDVSAVIPSTILNEIIRKVTVYGQVFSRVRKLSVKGGLTIPILSLIPTATWIGETTPSEKKKVQANTNISFSYYGLECKVSTSLLADTVTLAGFESVITDLIVEAMVKTLDLTIIKGDGNGKALGITVDNRVPAAQIITLTAADFVKWDAWKKKVFAKMPLSYKAGATFIMASGTFEGYIDGMTDDQGQPVGRVNYGITDGAQERFGGKEVIQVEDDVIAPYDDAAVGDVVTVYCNLKNYGFNSNMQMMMYRYFDHDTNEWVDKAILIADGKLIDPNGVVIIKKGA